MPRDVRMPRYLSRARHQANVSVEQIDNSPSLRDTPPLDATPVLDATPSISVLPSLSLKTKKFLKRTSAAAQSTSYDVSENSVSVKCNNETFHAVVEAEPKRKQSKLTGTVTKNIKKSPKSIPNTNIIVNIPKKRERKPKIKNGKNSEDTEHHPNTSLSVVSVGENIDETVSESIPLRCLSSRSKSAASFTSGRSNGTCQSNSQFRYSTSRPSSQNSVVVENEIELHEIAHKLELFFNSKEDVQYDTMQQKSNYLNKNDTQDLVATNFVVTDDNKTEASLDAFSDSSSYEDDLVALEIGEPIDEIEYDPAVESATDSLDNVNDFSTNKYREDLDDEEIQKANLDIIRETMNSKMSQNQSSIIEMSITNLLDTKLCNLIVPLNTNQDTKSHHIENLSEFKTKENIDINKECNKLIPDEKIFYRFEGVQDLVKFIKTCKTPNDLPEFEMSKTFTSFSSATKDTELTSEIKENQTLTESSSNEVVEDANVNTQERATVSDFLDCCENSKSCETLVSSSSNETPIQEMPKLSRKSKLLAKFRIQYQHCQQIYNNSTLQNSVIHKCPRCSIIYPSKFKLKKHICETDGLQENNNTLEPALPKSSQYSSSKHIEPVSNIKESKVSSHITDNIPRESCLNQDLTTLNCQLCSLSFILIKSLNKHYLKFHGITKDLINKIKFECQTCAICFQSKQMLENHFKKEHLSIMNTPIHNMSSKFIKFSCHKCSLTFESSESLKNHLLLHNTSHESVPCTFCKTKLSNQEELNEHLKIRHRLCKICCVLFKTKKTLEIHERNHESCCLVCSYCREEFTTPQNLYEHSEQTHAKTVVPGTSFKSSETNVTEENNVSNTCAFCGKYFNDCKKSLKEHYNIDHNVCMVCSEIFNSRDKLISHEKLHNLGGALSLFQCPSCEMEFNESYDLYRHSKVIHKTIIRPSYCHKIVEANTDSDENTTEITTTSDMSPNKISDINKDIHNDNLNSIQNHLNDLLDVNNEQCSESYYEICPYCDQQFSNESSFQKHTRDLHSMQKCTVCKNNFVLESQLNDITSVLCALCEENSEEITIIKDFGHNYSNKKRNIM